MRKMAGFGHYGLAIATTPTKEGDGSQLAARAQSSAAQSSTAQSSAAQQTTKSSSSSGIAPGAIAGAAVGALVVGLLLGFLGAWFLLKKRNSKNNSSTRNSYERSATTTREPDRKSYSAVPAAVTPSGGSGSASDIQLDQFLLDGAPDEEISNELRSLSDLIYQHVENNYELRPIQASVSDLSRSLQALGFVSSAGLDADTVAALCLDPKTRYSGLRNVISTVVFRSIDVHSRSPLSMLPAPVAAFLQSSATPDRHGGPQSAIGRALSNWRRLSAYLLHPNPAERTSLPLSDAVVTGQAAALVGALNTFLDHFTTSSEAGRRDQQEHLQGVIVEATKLGYVLFSHPSDWRFVHVADNARGAIVVCAGLDKTSQRDGTEYPKPKRVVAPVTVTS